MSILTLALRRNCDGHFLALRTGHAKDLHAAMALSSLDVGLLKRQAPEKVVLAAAFHEQSVDPGHIIFFESHSRIV